MNGSLNESDAVAMREAVAAAAAQPQVLLSLQGIYDDLALETLARKPVCDLSGRCCRFEDYGHRLYVTTIELAAFVAGLDKAPPAAHTAAAMRSWDGTGCPFQVTKLCGVHAIRPFGCRLFYCDPTATAWQNDLYERLHARIKQLHGRHDIPYYYVEWRQALGMVLPELAPV